MPKKKPNPDNFVTRVFCNERFGRIMDKLDVIDTKVDDLKNKQEEHGRDWRTLAISIASGVSVAVITWILSHL